MLDIGIYGVPWVPGHLPIIDPRRAMESRGTGTGAGWKKAIRAFLTLVGKFARGKLLATCDHSQELVIAQVGRSEKAHNFYTT